MNKVLRDRDISSDQNTSVLGQTGTHSLEGDKSHRQIPVLDGARAIACLGVLSLHLNLIAGQQSIWQPLHNMHNIHDLFGALVYFAASLAYAGDSGVILFFLLSSFLLFLPYAKALLFDSPWPLLHRFYLRRIFRILPGYYVALFSIVLFFHPEFLHSSHWHDLWLFLTLSMTTQLSKTLNGPFWTLAIEFQFYLLLPIIAWLFSLIVRRGTVHRRMFKLTLCLLVLVAWGLLTRYWGIYIANTSKLDFLIPHRVSMALLPFIYGDLGQPSNEGKYFEVFAIGMLICMIYTYTQYAASAEPWRIRIHRFSPLLFITGLALLSVLSFWYSYILNPTYPANHPQVHIVFSFLNPHIPILVSRHWLEWQALAYALGYGLCLWALLYGSARLKRPFEWPVLRWIASISFSLYMWHNPFITLFGNAINYNIRHQGLGPLVQYGAFWCWTLVIIIPISAVLYRWIEQPGIRLGDRLIDKLGLRGGVEAVIGLGQETK
ncbi:MAG TPA: acyltransferase [Ktedonobacteraceae bacterium]